MKIQWTASVFAQNSTSQRYDHTAGTNPKACQVLLPTVSQSASVASLTLYHTGQAGMIHF